MDDALRTAEQMTETLLQTLRLARAMAEAQREVALDGLADKAGFVCAKVMDLPTEDGRQLRPQLFLLLAEVDAMSAALRHQAPDHRQKAAPCSPHPQPS